MIDWIIIKKLFTVFIECYVTSLGNFDRRINP